MSSIINWLIPKAHAADEVTPATFNFGDLIKPLNDNNMGIGDLANRVLGWIFFIAGVLAVIYLVYSGILYITAGGNPDAAKKGQQGIINAIIGIVIIVLAYVIVRSVSGLLV